MTIRDNTTAPSSAPRQPSGPAPRRRSVESDRTSAEGDGRRSSVERVPADDRETDEIGPQRGYGGSRPDQGSTDR
jgi:hypothetical protein